MDSSRFDDLTKALATSTSRRQALQRIGGTLAGSLLAAWPFTQALAAGGGNSACAHFCAAVFGADTPAAKQCTSDAAHGKGLCHNCGSGTDPSSICCTRNSSGYCSSYSPTMPCSCGNGQGCCSGTCTDLNTTSNCGSCGNVCTTTVANATATCTNGVCGFVCNPGSIMCGNTCCASGQTCGSNGTCVTPPPTLYKTVCICGDSSGNATSNCIDSAFCQQLLGTDFCYENCSTHGGFVSYTCQPC